MAFLLYFLLPISLAAVIVSFLARHFRHQQLLELALDEQVRRELAHPVDYRGDQRERAIQQRLSRKMGKRAFSKKTLGRIQEKLDAHPTLGPWHRE